MAQLGYTQIYYLLTTDLNIIHNRLQVSYKCYHMTCVYIYETN